MSQEMALLGDYAARLTTPGTVSVGNPVTIAAKANRVAVLIAINSFGSTADSLTIRDGSSSGPIILTLTPSTPFILLHVKYMTALVRSLMTLVAVSGSMSVTVTEFTLGATADGLNALRLDKTAIPAGT